MAMESDAAVKTADADESLRTIDTPEFIHRLAEDMRVKSGSDLPLSCFIEQVKMQLAGKSRKDMANVADHITHLASASKYQSSDCFRSWAMPE
jgi:hypothetical protein